MKVFFEFPSGAEASVTSALSAVSVYDNAGSLDADYTPVCIGTLGGDFATGVVSAEALAAAFRQFYFEFPVAISAGSYKTGVYTFYADPGDGVTTETDRYVVGTIDTTKEAREIEGLMQTIGLMAIATGTEVVNPTLNERVIYNATIDAAGAVVDEKESILLRWKLYDAFSQSTSVNPVESRVFNSLLAAYIDAALTNSSGTTV